MDPEPHLEEFRDPVNDDLEEVPGSDDRIAMIREAGCRQGPTTLALGLALACGTGLVTLPLAAAGLREAGFSIERQCGDWDGSPRPPPRARSSRPAGAPADAGCPPNPPSRARHR